MSERDELIQMTSMHDIPREEITDIASEVADSVIAAGWPRVVTNVGPDQQAEAHHIAYEHAKRVAHG
jgi:hypothetical protein